jgi:hypothetical protein
MWTETRRGSSEIDQLRHLERDLEGEDEPEAPR